MKINKKNERTIISRALSQFKSIHGLIRFDLDKFNKTKWKKA